MIEKSEIKYLLISLVVIGLLVLSMNVETIYGGLSGLNPIWQFLIFNLFLIVAFSFLIKGIALKEKFGAVFKGALGTIIGFVALDLIIPPFLVSSQGLLEGGLYSQSASDYFFGYIYNHYLGISGILLPIMVYFVTFIVLFGIASLLIRNFVKKL